MFIVLLPSQKCDPQLLGSFSSTTNTVWHLDQYTAALPVGTILELQCSAHGAAPKPWNFKKSTDPDVSPFLESSMVDLESNMVGSVNVAPHKPQAGCVHSTQGKYICTWSRGSLLPALSVWELADKFPLLKLMVIYLILYQVLMDLLVQWNSGLDPELL